jgi:hypothetical protein
METHTYTNPSIPMGIHHFDLQYKINPPHPNPLIIKTHHNPPKQNHFLNPPKIPIYTHPFAGLFTTYEILR